MPHRSLPSIPRIMPAAAIGPVGEAAVAVRGRGMLAAGRRAVGTLPTWVTLRASRAERGADFEVCPLPWVGIAHDVDGMW